MLNKILSKKNSDISFMRGIKNVSFMSAGNVIGQIIGLVTVIFVARLFGPENYGIYMTVLVFVTFFHLFILGGLSTAVIREGSKKTESFGMILETTVGMRILFVFLAMMVCIGATFFTNYPKPLKIFIIIYSTEIIYFGLDSFLSTIYITTEKMQYLVYFALSTRLSITVLSIIFLYLGAGVFIILIINLLCRFSIIALNFFYSRRFVRFRLDIKLKVPSPLLKATIIFSLIKFINTFAVNIDVFMVSFLSTSIDVGIYSIAHEITKSGLMFRNIITVAFFPMAVKFFNSKETKIKTLIPYVIFLFLIVFTGCFILSFFSQDLVILFFGEKYSLSGHILKLLIFYLPFAFAMIPFTIYLQATHNEHILVIVYIITAATNVPLNIIFFYKFGLIGIAYSTLVVFFVESLIISSLTLRKIKSQGSLV